MNLEQEVLDCKSKIQINHIVSYIGNDTEKVALLMEMYFGSNATLTQKSSWIVNHIADNNLELISPYIELLISNLENNITDAVKRNTIRLLQFVEIPIHLQGFLTNICFDYLLQKDIAIAVKVFSMTVLFNICKTHPELANELKIVIEDMLPYGSAGIKSRGNKILRELERLS